MNPQGGEKDKDGRGTPRSDALVILPHLVIESVRLSTMKCKSSWSWGVRRRERRNEDGESGEGRREDDSDGSCETDYNWLWVWGENTREGGWGQMNWKALLKRRKEGGKLSLWQRCSYLSGNEERRRTHQGRVFKKELKARIRSETSFHLLCSSKQPTECLF